MSDGTTPLLADAEMRALGFTDHREGSWYWCKRVGSGESLNLTVDKASGNYDELVMDEMCGQPAYYGNMRPQFRDEIRGNVDRLLAELNGHGFTFAVDHDLYRSNR